jgi:hypothetical protein
MSIDYLEKKLPGMERWMDFEIVELTTTINHVAFSKDFHHQG